MLSHMNGMYGWTVIVGYYSVAVYIYKRYVPGKK